MTETIAKAEQGDTESFLRLAQKFDFNTDDDTTPESLLWTLLHDMLGDRFGHFPAVRRPEGVPSTEDGLSFYQRPSFYAPGWEVTVLEVEYDDGGLMDFRPRILNEDTLAKGWSLLCADYPSVAIRISRLEYDRDDADMLLQLALLGKVVYC